MNFKCRCCQENNKENITTLGSQPLANAFIDPKNLLVPSISYPLNLVKCTNCHFVQLDYDFNPNDIFDENYVYFSSTTSEFVEHARNYFELIQKKLNLNSRSFVVEIASNDGYLLQYFKNSEIPCLGIEPAKSVADEAIAKNIPTIIKFFTQETSKNVLELEGPADLIIGNNVIAHVPNLIDFLTGIKTLLSKTGTATLEFPHVMQMLKNYQFDTIYHEHYSYISLTSLNYALKKLHLKLYDADYLSTHGGSIRAYITHSSNSKVEPSLLVKKLLDDEIKNGVQSKIIYTKFANKSREIALTASKYLIDQALMGRLIVGYGAAAKANTFLNYCGINTNIIRAVADLTPKKIGKYLPGSRIPVISETEMLKLKPDIIIIFPWNWQKEIKSRLSKILDFDCKLVTVFPTIHVNSIGND